MHGSLSVTDGEMFAYSNADDDGASYIFDYESGWLDLGEEMNMLLKFVKRMTSFTFVTQNVVVTHKIKYDFRNATHAFDVAAGGSRVAEYGWDDSGGGAGTGLKYAEYGASGSYNLQDANAVPGTDIAEYGGGVSLRTLDAPGAGGGQYIKIGLRLDNNTGDFVLQQINLFAKVGRIAT